MKLKQYHVDRIKLCPILYVVVRHSADGYDYIDTSTLSSLPEEAKEKANEMDKFISGWARANKQIGLARLNVSIEEVIV